MIIFVSSFPILLCLFPLNLECKILVLRAESSLQPSENFEGLCSLYVYISLFVMRLQKIWHILHFSDNKWCIWADFAPAPHLCVFPWESIPCLIISY